MSSSWIARLSSAFSPNRTDEMFRSSSENGESSSRPRGQSQQPHTGHTHPHTASHSSSSSSSSTNTRFSRRPPAEATLKLSNMSTPAIPNSLFYCGDFMIGCGMAIIQPSSGKVVVVHDTKSNSWFLPKGRKDKGESLEQTALREAYEESGYRAELMPLMSPTHAPDVPGSEYSYYNTEPIYASTLYWGPRRNRGAGEYFTFWFVGQIPEGAAREEHTGMPDEQNYVSHLLTPEEAMQRTDPVSSQVINAAFGLWELTKEQEAAWKLAEETERSLNVSDGHAEEAREGFKF
ncbi:hypothetical protein K474DRAFT_1091141 [Panus rudis PR-1116 ss-1]|nr:hypothetical protein K474DRAFT_1091141 [Panus rudis PR-1116 ss-1]